MRRGIDDSIPTKAGVDRAERGQWTALEHSEATLTQGTMTPDRDAERRPDECRCLPRTLQVTRIDCPNCAVSKPICGFGRLLTTLLGQRGTFGVPLNQSECVPGALSVSHQPERAVVIVCPVHFL
jgi:hypothetical protein